MAEHIDDIVALLGLLMLGAGVWIEWGLGFALMACGSVVLALAIWASARNVSNSDSSDADAG